jgi:glycosyltransferase involved in cell wall biosynthesis
MAAGVPPVASAIGANNELIEHGVNGFLISDSSDWATYLEMLVRDQTLRCKLGLAARSWIADHRSIARILPEYVSVFESLVR